MFEKNQKGKPMVLRIRTADGEDHYYIVDRKQRQQLQQHLARAERRP